MFERIVIRQCSSASLGKTPDLGIIAEALLFYSDVRLVTNQALLPAILRAGKQRGRESFLIVQPESLS
jgi:hypothetical protein